MPYPEQMQLSLQRLEASRESRRDLQFPTLGFDEKKSLLERFHPDFINAEKTEILIGSNAGDRVQKELAQLFNAPSWLDPNRVDLRKIDLHTDVLVIGGGGAGVTAALAASQCGARVLLATKLRLGDSNTIMAEGGIGAATGQDDSPIVHYVDTMVGGRFTNIPELVEALVKDAPFILDWLTGLGVYFDRLPDGSYLTHMPGGHSRKRSHSVKDITGLEIMRVLCDEVRNQDLEFLEFTPAVEIILDEEGGCAGAVLYNLDTSNFLVVKAGAVILTTGGMGRLHPQGFPTSNHYGATADGLIIAYRAGAKMIYLDYIQYHPTGIAWPEQMLGLLISEALRAQGAQLANVNGEMFANRLETRDALSASIIRECAERGNGVLTPTGMTGVWLDTPLIDIIGGEGTFHRRFAGIYERFRKYDIDPVSEPILVYPTQHYQNGGIRIDVNGESSISGLYAAGEVAGGVHGHNRLGSNSLVDIFVFGRRAGIHAAGMSKKREIGKLSLDHIPAYNINLKSCGISSKALSPLLLPDYRFEKALTRIRHLRNQ
jgi:succinate dehydrogenase/fumarate reductase flavoprotein subunit